jgi:hypothetical protein
MLKIVLDALAVGGLLTLAILVWGRVKIYRSEPPNQTNPFTQ